MVWQKVTLVGVGLLGGSLGLAQSFAGIMAKQKRMAALTFALLAQAVEGLLGTTTYALLAGIAIIAAGSLVTCATRTRAMARELDPPW